MDHFPSDPSSFLRIPDDDLIEAWQRRLGTVCAQAHHANFAKNRPALDEVIRTMPKPWWFNRRAAEVATMIDVLVGMDLHLRSLATHPLIFEGKKGWTHNFEVFVREDTLSVGPLHDNGRTFRITPAQRQRFEELAQRWEAHDAEIMARKPSSADLAELRQQMVGQAALHREMVQQRSPSPAKRSYRDDGLQAWTSPSSLVANAYNGYGGFDD